MIRTRVRIRTTVPVRTSVRLRLGLGVNSDELAAKDPSIMLTLRRTLNHTSPDASRVTSSA